VFLHRFLQLSRGCRRCCVGQRILCRCRGCGSRDISAAAAAAAASNSAPPLRLLAGLASVVAAVPQALLLQVPRGRAIPVRIKRSS